MRNFRNYTIWKKAIELNTDIYTLIRKFPTYEKFGLGDQLRRASVSIASNIAEGAGRDSEKEFIHFLHISIGSAFEVETQVNIAYNLKYINYQEFTLIISKLHSIEKQINELIITIKRSQQPTNKS
jgi:four helix bundle protein